MPSAVIALLFSQIRFTILTLVYPTGIRKSNQRLRLPSLAPPRIGEFRICDEALVGQTL
jgi:hypothetical protein